MNRQDFERIRIEAQTQGNVNAEASALGAIGNLCAIDRNYAEAIQYHKQAMHLYESIADSSGIKTTAYNLAGIYHRGLGNIAVAIQYFEIAIAHSTGSERDKFIYMMTKLQRESGMPVAYGHQIETTQVAGQVMADSVRPSKSTQVVQQVHPQSSYNNQQRVEEIERLQRQADSSKKFTWIVAGIALVVTGVLLLKVITPSTTTNIPMQRDVAETPTKTPESESQAAAKQPTNTTEPVTASTEVLAAPTPTTPSTEVPHLETPIGAILKPGEEWNQNGKSILLSGYELTSYAVRNSEAVNVKWSFKNTSDHDVSVKFLEDNFNAISNNGQTASYKRFYGLPGGNGSTVTFGPGESIEFSIDLWIIYSDASVSNVTVSASLGDIQNARWEIPINH